MKKHTSSLIDKFRAWPWLLGSLITIGLVFLLDPHRIGLLIWSLSKLSLGAYLGYWIDRSVFHYARPGDVRVIDPSDRVVRLLCACMIRRAVIMAATIIALGLGV